MVDTILLTIPVHAEIHGGDPGFGVHCIGGITGALGAAIVASPALYPGSSDPFHTGAGGSFRRPFFWDTPAPDNKAAAHGATALFA
jgi:hypothetical protein